MNKLAIETIVYMYGRATVPILLLFTILLVGCSSDDWENRMKDSTNSLIQTIFVGDNGYIPAASTPTRAVTDEYYQTIFEEGDSIGVFGIQPLYNGNSPEFIMKNTKLTLIKIGNQFVWKAEQPETGSDPLALLSSNATYFAYYPYNEKTKDIWREDYYSEDAETFFSSEIVNWLSGTNPYATNPTLQNDRAAYNAKDLMIAKGTIETINGIKTLKFNMKHALSMVVIDFSEINPRSLASPPVFNSFSPYKYDDGKNIYRYLVPIEKEQVLSGNYTITGDEMPADNTWYFEFKHTGTAGTYNVYTIKIKEKTISKI